MAKPTQSGKLWTKEEIKTLKELAQKHTTARDIALKLHRTPDAVQSKASALKISLTPLKPKPHPRHKK